MIEKNLWFGAGNLLVILCSAFLCFYTVRASLRLPVWRVALYTVLFAVAVCAVDVLWIPRGWPEILTQGMTLLCGTLFFFRAVDEPRGKLLLLLLLVACFQYFCNAFWGPMYLLLPELNDAPYVPADVLLRALPIAVFIVPFTLLLRGAWRRMRSLQTLPWYRLCALAGFFVLLFFLIVALRLDDVISQSVRLLLVLFVSACAISIFWMILSMLGKATEAARYAEALRQTDTQLRLQAQRMEAVAAGEEAMRMLRHDMRHHLDAVGALIETGQTAQATAYLRGVEAQIEGVDTPLCAHLMVDALTRRYLALARSREIEADAVIALPREAGIRDEDLAVLLGNLWDNALEAIARQTEGRRFVQLRIRTRGEGVLIDMRNSYGGAVYPQGEGFLSVKRHGAQEGVGIRSIQAIAKRYGGMAQFTADGGAFVAEIVLYQGKDTDGL